MTPIRLEHTGPRVETGTPIQFGNDWPGIFIRGDDCMRLAMSLEMANEHKLYLMQAKGFIGLLRQADVRTHELPAAK